MASELDSGRFTVRRTLGKKGGGGAAVDSWQQRAAIWSVRMASLGTGGRFGTLTDFQVVGEDPHFNMRHLFTPHELWRDVLRFAGWWHAGVPLCDMGRLTDRDVQFHNLYVTLMVERVMLLLAWHRNERFTHLLSV